MSDYFYILLVASVCGGVCAMLAYGGFEKYIKYIASLICVVIIISPLREMDIDQLLDVSDGDIFPSAEQSDSLYPLASELAEQRAEEYISEIVSNKFGIKPVYTDIKIDWALDEPIIENIYVALNTGDMQVASEAQTYLTDVLGGEVQIIEAE